MTDSIRMTAAEFTVICLRANDEAVTTNRIDELVNKECGGRVYSGTMSAQWEADGIILVQREYYDMTEDHRGNESYLDYGVGERFGCEPNILIIDENGEESELQYWDIMNDHSDMIDRKSVYDHSTMPDAD